MGYSDHCHGHWRNLFAAMGVAPHELSYEALVADYRQTIAALFARLGSAAAPPPVRMRPPGPTAIAKRSPCAICASVPPDGSKPRHDRNGSA